MADRTTQTIRHTATNTATPYWILTIFFDRIFEPKKFATDLVTSDAVSAAPESAEAVVFPTVRAVEFAAFPIPAAAPEIARPVEDIKELRSRNAHSILSIAISSRSSKSPSASAISVKSLLSSV